MYFITLSVRENILQIMSRVLNDTVDEACNIIDVYYLSYVTYIRTTLQSQKETYSNFSLQ